MDESALRDWLAAYLEAFAACASGAEPDVSTLLDYYAVPLLVTSDDFCVSLQSADEVVRGVGGEVERLRAAGYRRSEPVETSLHVLNATTALYRATFSRRGPDDAELDRATVTYLVCDVAAGRRIAGLLVHGA
jgi:hypothetical protein